MYRIGLLCLALLAGCYIHAQTISLDAVARITMPLQDNKALLAEEEARDEPNTPPRFAVSLPVNINPSTDGTWDKVAGDKLRWRVRIFSAKAKSINLGITDFYMPPGGTLHLYSLDQTMMQGPFTPADNEAHGQLWTPIVEGEELVVEVILPTKAQNQLLLHIGYVNHDFLGFGQLLSGSCNLDVNCGLLDGFGIVDGYRDIIRSVGVYGLNGGTFCTGFLINNVENDCRPFFMTANHCGLDTGNAPTLVAYWNFENSTCRQPNSGASGGFGDGVLTQFNSGAIYRAGWAGADFALVELDDEVPKEYLPFFAGFDATNAAPGDSVVCIHHPGTDEKRISFEFDPTNIGNSNSSPNPNGDYVVVNDWDIGTTEVGSSGSPLFNKQKRVIGQLLGGGAACGNNLSDNYGWIHRSWTGGGTPNTRLQDWLDPNNTGTMVMDGRDCGTVVLVNPISLDVCSPADGIYNLSASAGFIDSIQLSINGLPAGVNALFNQNPIAPGQSATLTLSNLAPLLAGNYSFTLTGTDGIDTSIVPLFLIVNLGVPTISTLSPMDEEMNVFPVVQLEWVATPLTQYEIEVATDSTFLNLAAFGGVQADTWSPGMLDEETTYYWRVRGTNACGIGNYSEIKEFRTGAVFCESRSSTDVPKPISAGGASTITSTLVVAESGSIGDVNIRNLTIDHSWVGDLTITLTSPQGTSVVLLDQIDCNMDDILADFDDEALLTQADLINSCQFSNPAIGGAFQPLEALAAFKGESIQGIWTLTITDNAFGDGGSLNAWDLEFCRSEVSAVLPIPQAVEICLGSGVDFDIQVGNAFNDNPGVVLTVTDLPAGVSYTVNTVPAFPNTLVGASLSAFSTTGTYEVQINGIDGLIQRSAKLTVNVIAEPEAGLMLPVDSATQVSLSPTLHWQSDFPADSFKVEVALDAGFSNIVQTKISTVDSVNLDPLNHAIYYHWRVYGYNDCGEGLSIAQVFATEWATGLSNDLGTAVYAYPNPARDQLYIDLETPLAKELKWEIINLTGQTIGKGVIAAGQVATQIPLSQWADGMYLIRLSHQEGRFTERFLIQK